MRFNSSFGIGEIVSIENIHERREGQASSSHLGEVIGIHFDANGANYIVRIHTGQNVLTNSYQEWQLVGDPDYNQETGSYPLTEDDE